MVGAGVLGLCGAYQYLHTSLPDVAAIRDIRLQVPLRVYSRDGKLMAQFGEQRRVPLSFDDIPQQLVNAVLAAEDDNFFEHSGVDYPGLARATIRHLLSGEKSEGGSTITMQLTRGIFLSPEKSYRRKLLEIFLTLRIEQQFSKQEILTLYLNKSFLGQRAYGVGAAAEVYFGKTIDQLTVPEIALIAGTFRLPSRDNPVANADLARSRRSYVLRRMSEKGHITKAERDAADASPVESKLHGPAIEIDSPYIAEMVRADMYSRLGTKAYTAGYEAITSIDSRLQATAIGALRSAVVEYDQRHGYRGPVAQVTIPAQAREAEWSQLLDEYPRRGGLEPALILSVDERNAVAWSVEHGRVNLPWDGLKWARPALDDAKIGAALSRASDAISKGDVVYVVRERAGSWRLAQVPEAQAAFVAMDPQDGAIAALVGGFDYYGSNYNRAVQAKRQPGSAFKPILYSAALEHGFTPASVVNDAPLVIDDPSMEAAWRPQNSGGELGGPMRLREALVRSRNLVSIRVMNSIGPSYVTKYAQRFGLDESTLPQNLTLALGTAQVSPLEMAGAYSVFANGGYRVEPYFIDRIRGPDGKVIYEAQPRFACPGCVEEDAGALDAAAVDAGNDDNTPIQSVTNDERSWGGLNYLQEKMIAPRSISPQNDYLMADMMGDVVRRGTGRRARALNRDDLAGKTGTTNDWRDAWFCGFSSSLVATAWMGFDRERTLGRGEEGSSAALPMWMYFMSEALQGVPEHARTPPPGVVTMRISADTGLAARPGQSDAIFEMFMAGHLPAEAPFDSASMDIEGSASTERPSEEPLF